MAARGHLKPFVLVRIQMGERKFLRNKLGQAIALIPHGVMAAQETLNLLDLVRVQMGKR